MVQDKAVEETAGMIIETTAKKKIYDSVFTHLFRQPEYTVQLYRVLHPEDQDITEAQIRIVTLENFLLNQPYNDLGFLAGDRLLILVEAQSTWSENILVRVLLYLAQTIQNYIVETRQNIYGSKKVQLPEPEFHVIFTGERKEKPSQLILSREYYGGRENAVEVRVNILYDSAEGDIINQYVTFTKIYKKQQKIYGRTRTAVLETLRICRDKGVLREYLESREKEVIDIMDILFNQEYAWGLYEDELRQEGRREGRQEGRREKAKETVRNMAGRGYAAEEIAEVLAVSVEQTKAWLEEEMCEVNGTL